MLRWVQELMKNTCEMGATEDYFYFTDEISLEIKIFEFPASKMFIVAVFYHKFFK